MHELAIVEGILRTAVPEAEKHGARRILNIRLGIGELSGVMPEYLRHCFVYAAAGTIAQGAGLVIEPIPVSVRCRDCGYEGPIDRKDIRCPSCGGEALTITGGRELFVDSLEVE